MSGVTEFAIAAKKVENAVQVLRQSQGYVEAAEEDLRLHREALREAEVDLTNAREEFFDAYPELRPVVVVVVVGEPAPQPPGATMIAGGGQFTPVEVDDENDVPGPSPDSRDLDFTER